MLFKLNLSSPSQSQKKKYMCINATQIGKRNFFCWILVMLYLFFIFDQNPGSSYIYRRGLEYKYNKNKFDRKAREYTKKYCEKYFSNDNEKDEEDKFLSVIFSSTDQVIHYSIVCKFENYFS